MVDGGLVAGELMRSGAGPFEKWHHSVQRMFYLEHVPASVSPVAKRSGSMIVDHALFDRGCDQVIPGLVLRGKPLRWGLAHHLLLHKVLTLPIVELPVGAQFRL